MAIRLTIDQGNTAAKAAVWNDDQIVAESTYNQLTASDITALAKKVKGRFDASIYSTVKTASYDIISTMKNLSSKFIELNQSTPLPISIEYATPETLGRDRIAAAVGAYSYRFKEWALVVDCGTAITYDIVSPEGKFIGGNIAPGIFMRLEALNKFTSRLPLIDIAGNCPSWGYDTETALRAGAINGVIGELTFYKDKLPAGTRIFLTGGSADIIAQKTEFDLIVDHQLVSKGLKSIIDYNENI